MPLPAEANGSYIEKSKENKSSDIDPTFQNPACKVHVANIEEGGKPASAPSPCNNHRVDEAGHDKGVGSIGGAPHALCNCTADDCSTSCAEGL